MLDGEAPTCAHMGHRYFRAPARRHDWEGTAASVAIRPEATPICLLPVYRESWRTKMAAASMEVNRERTWRTSSSPGTVGRARPEQTTRCVAETGSGSS